MCWVTNSFDEKMKHNRRIDNVLHDCMHYSANIYSYIQDNHVKDAQVLCEKLCQYLQRQYIEEMKRERNDDKTIRKDDKRNP